MSFRDLIPQPIRSALGRLFRGPGTGDAPTPVLTTFEHQGLSISCHAAWPADAHLAERWRLLAAQSPMGATFLGPDWMRGLVEQFPRPGRLRLLTVERAGRLLGVLPLERTAAGGLETCGAPFSDYLDPLVAEGEQPTFWAGAMAALAALTEDGDRDATITLHNVRPEWPGHSALAESARQAGFALEQTAADPTLRLALDDSWDAYLARLDAHERKELRRKMNKATTQAGARLVAAPADELGALLPRALDMMAAAGGEKGQAIAQYVRPLLSCISADLVARGAMRLLVLMLRDAPAACLVEFPSPQGPMVYNSGFDTAQREFSPGIVVMGLAIQQAIESRARCLDLLRGREPYKYKLGATEHPLMRLTLRAPG